MEIIKGYVDHIIYRNTENGYTVLVLVCEEEELTCVGIFSDIVEGENIEARGEYTDHPTYGRQFKVHSFEEKAPEDEIAIERYLGSGAIKGIGLALASRSKGLLRQGGSPLRWCGLDFDELVGMLALLDRGGNSVLYRCTL